MKNVLFTFLLFVVAVSSLHAQVAINSDGSAPDPSAILDVKSTNKGLLLPRMSTKQISYITSPTAGLLVFNIDSADMYCFDGTNWIGLMDNSDTINPWICGSNFTDDRDNKSYPSVQIGTQCWMAKSLNIGTMIQSNQNQTDNDVIEKHCYDNDPANCDIYGGKYTWQEMMQYATLEGEQGICPEGWHIPTNDEWKTLTNFLGGQDVAGGKLKETGTVHWKSPNTDATNSSGFTGLPGGHGGYQTYYGLSSDGRWWASSLHDANYAYARRLVYDDGKIPEMISSISGNTGSGVRCVKD